MGCACAAAALLRHSTLWLLAYSGACVVTAARLRWDPSTYVAARLVLPAEAAAAPAVLCATALLLAALAHAAHAALALRAPTRRAIALRLVGLYAGALLAGLCWGGLWARARVLETLRSADARRVAELLAELREHLAPLLRSFARLHLLSDKYSALVEEANEDLPRNLYVAGAAAAALVALLVSTAALALLAAPRAPRTPRTPRTPHTHRTPYCRKDVESGGAVSEWLQLAR